MAQKHNKLFYEKSLDKYGITAQGVHWNSKHTQYKRFEIITQFIKNDIISSSIIDAGCGCGEYYNYLKLNHKIPKYYIGIDCEQQMISICKKQFPQQDFRKLNILTQELEIADYYICSGALNILTKEEIYLFIEKCFINSKKGFIFNFLKTNDYTNLSVDNIIDFCKTLTSKIQFKDNYLDNDFSIYLTH